MFQSHQRCMHWKRQRRWQCLCWIGCDGLMSTAKIDGGGCVRMVWWHTLLRAVISGPSGASGGEDGKGNGHHTS